jgi:hypothetical protein
MITKREDLKGFREKLSSYSCYILLRDGEESTIVTFSVSLHFNDLEELLPGLNRSLA